MIYGDHPEDDSTVCLYDKHNQRYQMLVGMLNWIVCLGGIDIGFATPSLSRFTACPSEGHMKRILRVYDYLKIYKNGRYVVNSRDPILVGGKDYLEKDYTKMFENQYPDASEEIDSRLLDTDN